MDELSKREPVVLGVYGLDEAICSGINHSNVPKIQFFYVVMLRCQLRC